MAAFLFIILATLIFSVYNTGSSVNRRVQAQNAADASAHSAAVWHARGLNLISLNNQASTRSIAAVLAIRGLDRTLDVAFLNVQTMRADAAAMIVLGIQTNNYQMVIQGVQKLQRAQRENDVLGTVRAAFTKSRVSLLTADSTGALWAMAQGMDFFSTSLAQTIPYVSRVRAMQLARWNTEGAGIGCQLWPDGLPVIRGQFEEWETPLTTGTAPYPAIGRMGGSDGRGGARNGPYNRMYDELEGFFRRLTPETTKQGMVWQRSAGIEYAYVFSNPAQSWMPRPYLLTPELRFPQLATRSGADIRLLGVWAAVGSRSRAPFWTHRFINPMPADLTFAIARAKVTNPSSWDLWTPQWRAKLTHADFTYDRIVDGNAVGPEQLADTLFRMIESGAFDTLYRDAINIPGRMLPGPDSDPRETALARELLLRLSRGDLQWDPVIGRALITH